MNLFKFLAVAVLAISLMGARGCTIEIVGEETEPEPKPCIGDDCPPTCDSPDCKPMPQCADLEGVFFGYCDMFLGYAVVGRECQPVSGCDGGDYRFFESHWACEEKCLEVKEGCEEIEEKYYATLEQASYCHGSDECQVLWGQCGSGLGGCYEAANLSLTQEELSEFGEAYWEAGCVSAVCDCMEFTGSAVCREHRCELDWNIGATCEDLAGVDFGPCDYPLGVGVIEGECVAISGCESLGYSFFESLSECRAECEPSDCLTDSDCVLFADYCSDCSCEAWPDGVLEMMGRPVCQPSVQCFQDPCLFFDARCVQGRCTAVQDETQ